MTKKTKIRIEILSLLNQLEVSDRIDLIESIGKRLRQQNSISMAKDIQQFVSKNRLKKDVEFPEYLKAE